MNPGPSGLYSQRLQITLVDSAVRKLYLLKIIVQRLLHFFFGWPMLPHFFKGRALFPAPCHRSITLGAHRE